MSSINTNERADYDVVIVGAGPAGSGAALAAAKAGCSALILERKMAVGSPVRCGEGIGMHWVEEFNMKLNPKAISSEINGALLVSPDNKHEVQLRTKESKGYVVDRKVFDKDLAMDAARAGAELSIKSEVTGVLKAGSKVSGVEFVRDGEKHKVNCKVLIAADGGETRVARWAGLPSICAPYDTDFGYEYEMVNVPVQDLIEIYFSNTYAPRGYLWIFPKGKDTANVGVGIGGHMAPYARQYLDKWIQGPMKTRLKDAEAVAVKGGIIPVGAPLKQMTADNFMVVGEAAHVVDPIHGGGISLAIDSGAVAGRVAAECVKAGKTDNASLSRYRDEWGKVREGKLLKRLLLRKVLEQLNDDDLNAVFEVMTPAMVDKLLVSDFPSVVQAVLKKRPQLIKAVGALLK